MSICGGWRYWTGEVIYPEIEEFSNVIKISIVIKGNEI